MRHDIVALRARMWSAMRASRTRIFHRRHAYAVTLGRNRHTARRRGAKQGTIE
jgi:hypothetical protein